MTSESERNDVKPSFYEPFLEHWSTDLIVLGLRPRTITKKKAMMRRTGEFAKGNEWPEDPAEITEEQVEAYKTALMGKGYAYPTLKNCVSNLTQFVAWAKAKKAATAGGC